ncbi:MAG: glucoamylase family protein [Bacteroidota bacterium]
MRRLSFIVPFLVVSLQAHAQLSEDAILDTIQHTALNFFWQEANPLNGLIRDRSRSDAPSSIASVGFGLSAICIGVDHGWVSRAVAADRVQTTLQTFWRGPQGSGNGYIGQYGLFYHFLDMNTATRVWDSELSTIDTGLLLAGIVDAKQYFTGADPVETHIRALADSIYERMNWDLMRNYNTGIMMGWMPGTGFAGYGQWTGYNEAMIMYILAMGSPTYPVGADGWTKWTFGYRWVNYYGFQHVGFAPLFGHQYSHCWIDFRGIEDAYMRDKGIDYFENSRRATYAQRAYCIENPHGYAGYNDSLWGITASDTPTGYKARGAPPDEGDDGTLVPTAPVSSIPFAPEIVMPVIRNMWNNYRTQLWTPYGFRDAFNIGLNWWDTDIIGIDQGPMIIMIENYRTGKVWERFMRSAEVQRGLQAAGFAPVTAVDDKPVPLSYRLEQNFPNPFNPVTTIRYEVPSQSIVTLAVYDLLGREVALLLDGEQTAGVHRATFDATGLASGVYVYRIRAGVFTASRTMVLLK